MNKLKKRQIFYLLSLTIFCLGIFLAYSEITAAPISGASAQDSDYDGLTDQVEKNVYHTDSTKVDSDGDGYLDSTEILVGSNPLNPNNLASSLSDQSAPTVEAKTPGASSLPWYVARAAGLAAYGLMFLIVMLGTGMTTSYIYHYINPVKAWVIHKYLSLALGLTLLAHIIALSLDKFINFTWLDILIPFSSDYKPLFLSAGIMAFYLLLVVIFTSLFFRLKYKKSWRGVHYTVYPLFILSLIHGIYTGTDSGTIWMQTVYWTTGLIFFSLLLYRFVILAIRQRDRI